VETKTTEINAHFSSILAGKKLSSITSLCWLFFFQKPKKTRQKYKKIETKQKRCLLTKTFITKTQK